MCNAYALRGISCDRVSVTRCSEYCSVTVERIERLSANATLYCKAIGVSPQIAVLASESESLSETMNFADVFGLFVTSHTVLTKSPDLIARLRLQHVNYDTGMLAIYLRRLEFFRRWTVSLELSACYIT